MPFTKVKDVRSQDGIYLAQFDQCQFGLVSKVSRKPVKKRTFVLTNCRQVFENLHQKFCPGNHTHQIIQGSEGGKKRSEAAQEYPDALVAAICQGFLAAQQQR